MVLNNIDYHICDACNLNCASCNHFSPLTTESNMVTLAKAKTDFELLETINDKFNKLTILGGEACLNPYFIPIIELSIQMFPGKVKLITNGTIPKPLYDLKEKNIDSAIELIITEYPFKSNFREHYDILKNDFPTAIFYTFRHEHGFISEHLSYEPLDTPNELILNCEKRFKCVQFINGKLYICHYAGYLDNLRKITEFEFANWDAYIDIKNCTNEQFDDFFTNKIPEICRHCKFVQKPYEKLNKKPWNRTEKNPKEWIY